MSNSQPTGDKIRVIYIDDDEDLLFLTKLNLEKVSPKLEVVGFTDANLFLEEISRREYDCIITDYKMLAMDGISLAIKIRELTETPIMLYTGQGSEEVAEQAFSAGIDDYARKDVGINHYTILSKHIENLVEKAQHKKDLARKTAILEELQLYATQLNMVHTVEDVASITLKIIYKLFGFDKSIFFIKRNHTLELAASTKENYNCEPLDINGPGLIALSAREEKTLLVNDVHDSPDYCDDEEIRSKLVVPVMFNGEVLAVMNVVSDLDGFFSERDKPLMELLSIHVGISLRRIEQEISQKIYKERLEGLHHYSSMLAQTASLEEIVSIIKKTIDDIFEPDSGSFAFVRGNVLRHEFIWSMENYRIVEMPLEGKGITVRAVNKGASQLVKNTEDDPEFKTFFPDVKSKSELAVPIKINGVVIAVLNLESNKFNAFDENDQRLLEIFSEHVAASMERLNQKNLIEKMERMRIRETLEGYKKISQMVRHDLRNPLTNLQLALKIMKDHPEKSSEMMGLIEKNVSFAEEIMNDWKLQTMSGDLQIQQVNVLGLVRDTLEFVKRPENVDVSVSIQNDLVLPLDYNRMKRVFVNLIVNSYEAMSDGGKLEISSQIVDGKTEITVKDSGVGMTKEQMRNLFQPFFTTKTHGTGLGLAYCKQTVNDHNGEIYVNSEILKGTEFIIVFNPQKREEPDQVDNEVNLIQFMQA